MSLPLVFHVVSEVWKIFRRFSVSAVHTRRLPEASFTSNISDRPSHKSVAPPAHVMMSTLKSGTKQRIEDSRQNVEHAVQWQRTIIYKPNVKSTDYVYYSCSHCMLKYDTLLSLSVARKLPWNVCIRVAD